MGIFFFHNGLSLLYGIYFFFSPLHILSKLILKSLSDCSIPPGRVLYILYLDLVCPSEVVGFLLCGNF